MGRTVNAKTAPVTAVNETFKAVFGRDSNYLFNSRESVINAYDNLKSLVDTLPAEEKGSVYITDRVTGQKYTPDSLRADPKFTSDVMDNKQFAVEWEYKKDYDLLDVTLNGPDSVKTILDFGIKFDISKIAQTTFGKWITPSGKFAPWIEQGLGRQSERAAYLSSQTLNIIKTKLGDGKLKPVLAAVVSDASQGLDPAILQNVTAAAVASMQQAGAGKIGDHQQATNRIGLSSVIHRWNH